MVERKRVKEKIIITKCRNRRGNYDAVKPKDYDTRRWGFIWVGGCFYRLSLEVNEDSSCDLSDEDEEEAGEVL